MPNTADHILLYANLTMRIKLTVYPLKIVLIIKKRYKYARNRLIIGVNWSF